VTEFEEKVLADLATLKAQMSTLLGNGQPGRMRELELRVEKHEHYVQRALGIISLVAAIATAVNWQP
jgi:hypothetical protein